MGEMTGIRGNKGMSGIIGKGDARKRGIMGILGWRGKKG